jgi:hypothetical protein
MLYWFVIKYLLFIIDENNLKIHTIKLANIQMYIDYLWDL